MKTKQFIFSPQPGQMAPSHSSPLAHARIFSFFSFKLKNTIRSLTSADLPFQVIFSQRHPKPSPWIVLKQHLPLGNSRIFTSKVFAFYRALGLPGVAEEDTQHARPRPHPHRRLKARPGMPAVLGRHPAQNVGNSYPCTHLSPNF